MIPTFTAKLCGADGARAGCGPCVRPAGHPVGAGEFHRDARKSEFFIVEKCPFCEALHDEGADLAEHVRAEHGGAVEVVGKVVTDHAWHNDGTGPGCARFAMADIALPPEDPESETSRPCLKPKSAHVDPEAHGGAPAPAPRGAREQLGLFATEGA